MCCISSISILCSISCNCSSTSRDIQHQWFHGPLAICKPAYKIGRVEDDMLVVLMLEVKNSVKALSEGSIDGINRVLFDSSQLLCLSWSMLS